MCLRLIAMLYMSPPIVLHNFGGWGISGHSDALQMVANPHRCCPASYREE